MDLICHFRIYDGDGWWLFIFAVHVMIPFLYLITSIHCASQTI